MSWDHLVFAKYKHGFFNSEMLFKFIKFNFIRLCRVFKPDIFHNFAEMIYNMSGTKLLVMSKG